MGPFTPEPKVVAATGGSAFAGLVEWLLDTYVFHGSVPGPVGTFVYIAAPAAAAFVAGWSAKHVNRGALVAQQKGS
jgi:hypothetical protein